MPVLPDLDEGDAVVARIDVEEVGRERLGEIVAQLEAEDVDIERNDVVDLLAVEHGVTHAERAGAESGDRAAGLERIAGGLGAVHHLEAVAGRIVEHDQVLDVPLVGERPRAARDLHAVVRQMRGVGVERRGVGDLPAVEARRLGVGRVDHEPLLAVVHAEGERAAALVHELHAEELAAVGRPVLEVLGADSDITQRFKAHRGLPAANNV